mmetsp:Transcript_69664/g.145262  ORF Transcript_69664/g.145262 Transcript_69664/m.145262 type:complete len:227 (+) Transcript_69664:310-990(+)
MLRGRRKVFAIGVTRPKHGIVVGKALVSRFGSDFPGPEIHNRRGGVHQVCIAPCCCHLLELRQPLKVFVISREGGIMERWDLHEIGPSRAQELFQALFQNTDSCLLSSDSRFLSSDSRFLRFKDGRHSSLLLCKPNFGMEEFGKNVHTRFCRLEPRGWRRAVRKGVIDEAARGMAHVALKENPGAYGFVKDVIEGDCVAVHVRVTPSYASLSSRYVAHRQVLTHNS